MTVNSDDFGVDYLADGTPVGLWFIPGIIEPADAHGDNTDRVMLDLDNLRQLRDQLNSSGLG